MALSYLTAQHSTKILKPIVFICVSTKPWLELGQGAAFLQKVASFCENHNSALFSGEGEDTHAMINALSTLSPTFEMVQ